MNEYDALAWIDAWPNRWQQESGCGWAIASNDGVLGRSACARYVCCGDG